MKRSIAIIAATVLFIVFSGVFLRNPPSLMDALTGATRKSKAKTSAAAPAVPAAARQPGCAE